MSLNDPKDGSLQSTRQMLDELDALMERMLALPVNDLEDAPPLPAKEATPTLASQLALLQAPTPMRSAGTPTSQGPTTHPATNPPHLVLPPMSSAPVVAPLRSEPTPETMLPRMEPLLAKPPQLGVSLLTRWVYAPLLWVNERFDQQIERLGEYGDPLRRPAARGLLGLGGAALIVLSVGWLLKDWVGWN